MKKNLRIIVVLAFLTLLFAMPVSAEVFRAGNLRADGKAVNLNGTVTFAKVQDIKAFTCSLERKVGTKFVAISNYNVSALFEPEDKTVVSYAYGNGTPWYQTLMAVGKGTTKINIKAKIYKYGDNPANAKTYNIGSFNVVVKNQIAQQVTGGKNITIYVGDTADVTVKAKSNLTVANSNSAVASMKKTVTQTQINIWTNKKDTVGMKLTFKGLKAGTTKYTVRAAMDNAYSQKTVTYTVTVKDLRSQTISCSSGNLSMKQGAKKNITVTAPNAVTVSTDNSRVVSVSNKTTSGNKTTVTLTANKEGTATITIRAAEGNGYKQATKVFKVTVEGSDYWTTLLPKVPAKIKTAFNNDGWKLMGSGYGWNSEQKFVVLDTNGQDMSANTVLKRYASFSGYILDTIPKKNGRLYVELLRASGTEKSKFTLPYATILPNVSAVSQQSAIMVTALGDVLSKGVGTATTWSKTCPALYAAATECIKALS